MTCDSCKRGYRLWCIVDSEDWEKIARDDYALCYECMEARFIEIGLSVECEFLFDSPLGVDNPGMHSVRTPRVSKIGVWRHRGMVKDGSVGLPVLYRHV
jgi:hypothetical protein